VQVVVAHIRQGIVATMELVIVIQPQQHVVVVPVLGAHGQVPVALG